MNLALSESRFERSRGGVLMPRRDRVARARLDDVEAERRASGFGMGALGIGAIAASGSTTFNGNFGALFTGVLMYLRSDLGITSSSGNITAWADQSGNGVNVTPAGVLTKIGTVGTGLNSHASVIADGSTCGGQYTLALPAAGTTPTFIWSVWRLLGATNTPSYLTTDTSNFAQAMFVNNGTTNLFIQSSSAVGPVTAATNSWGRSEARYSNSSSDYIKFGSASAVTGNPGNVATSGTRGLFCTGNGSNKLNAEMLVFLILNNVPTGGALTAASAAVTSFYGGTVAV